MKTITGIVVSNKMSKTVVVERTLIHKHPLYKKILRRQARIKARSESPLQVGDTVKIASIKPLSKDVHYTVVEKLS